MATNQGSPPLAAPHAPTETLPLPDPAPRQGGVAATQQPGQYNAATVMIQQHPGFGPGADQHPGVGRGANQVPSVLGPQGGPGTGGVGQPAQNGWASA